MVETAVPRFLVLGNPGIGKSTFLLYCLYRFVQAGRPVHISFPQHSPPFNYLFHGNTATEMSTDDAIRNEIKGNIHKINKRLNRINVCD